MDWDWRICAEKSEDGSISRYSHGHNFLGLTWYNINRLSTKGKNYYRRVLASLLDRFHAILKEKRLYLAKKCFSTTTMHQLTRMPLQRPNYLINATTYFLIHLILQIWLLAIILCLLTWKIGFVVKDFY